MDDWHLLTNRGRSPVVKLFAAVCFVSVLACSSPSTYSTSSDAVMEEVCLTYARVIEDANALSVGKKEGMDLYVTERLAEMAGMTQKGEEFAMNRAIRELWNLNSNPGTYGVGGVKGEYQQGLMASRQVVRLCSAEGLWHDGFEAPEVVVDVLCAGAFSLSSDDMSQWPGWMDRYGSCR